MCKSAVRFVINRSIARLNEGGLPARTQCFREGREPLLSGRQFVGTRVPAGRFQPTSGFEPRSGSVLPPSR